MKATVLAVIVAALVLPGVAAAGPPIDDARARAVAGAALTDGIPAYLQLVARSFQRKQQEADDTFVAGRATPHAEALGDAPATPIAELASVAIKTKVDGALAGVTFAPLALLGASDADARNATITVATLDGGNARVGVAYASQRRAAPMTLTRLGFAPCGFDREGIEAHVKAIVPTFASTCAALAGLWREGAPGRTAEDDTAWLKVAAACDMPAMLDDGETHSRLAQDLGRRERGNPESRVAAVLLWSERVVPALPDAQLRKDLARATTDLGTWIESVPTATSCIDSAEVQAAIIRARWHATTRQWSASVLTDLFARKYGFNPDDNPGTSDIEKPLTDGQLKAFALKGAYGRSHGATTWTAALGLKAQRAAVSESMVFGGTFELGIERIAFGLGRRRLFLDDGSPNLDDKGQFPAHVVAGIKLSGSVLGKDPDGAELRYLDQVDAFEVTPYLDFKFAEKITFRLGVPIRAEILTRKADAEATPAITVRRGRQWTVPVFITAAIPIGG